MALIGIWILLAATVSGLVLWMASELPLAIREMAMNTRKEEGGSEYPLLKTLSVLLRVLAVAAWILGLVGSIIVFAFGPKVVENFMGMILGSMLSPGLIY